MDSSNTAAREQTERPPSHSEVARDLTQGHNPTVERTPNTIVEVARIGNRATNGSSFQGSKKTGSQSKVTKLWRRSLRECVRGILMIHRGTSKESGSDEPRPQHENAVRSTRHMSQQDDYDPHDSIQGDWDSEYRQSQSGAGISNDTRFHIPYDILDAEMAYHDGQITVFVASIALGDAEIARQDSAIVRSGMCVAVPTRPRQEALIIRQNALHTRCQYSPVRLSASEARFDASSAYCIKLAAPRFGQNTGTSKIESEYRHKSSMFCDQARSAYQKSIPAIREARSALERSKHAYLKALEAQNDPLADSKLQLVHASLQARENAPCARERCLAAIIMAWIDYDKALVARDNKITQIFRRRMPT